MKTYNPEACCGTDCSWHDTEGEPCWGDVTVIDEVQYGEDEWGWIHACEGHLDDGKYKEEQHDNGTKRTGEAG